MKKTAEGGTMTADESRRRPRLNITLSHAAHARLEALALRFDGNLSRTLEDLIRSTPLPRPTAQEKETR